MRFFDSTIIFSCFLLFKKYLYFLNRNIFNFSNDETKVFADRHAAKVKRKFQVLFFKNKCVQFDHFSCVLFLNIEKFTSR